MHLQSYEENVLAIWASLAAGNPSFVLLLALFESTRNCLFVCFDRALNAARLGKSWMIPFCEC